MEEQKQFDVIIVGGSYAGLAAGMALGRALKKVLIIDAGKSCNRQTPFSHNFITQDGRSPAAIATLAKEQVQMYSSISFFNGWATEGRKTGNGFEIQVASREIFTAKKLIFATGITDMLPGIDGFAACWGISVLHCPYCHGYEVRHEKTGVLGNGEQGFEFSRLISNWTSDLTLFTNGISVLTAVQRAQLDKHRIKIVETEIRSLEQSNGQLQGIVFKDGTRYPLEVMYAPTTFEQHCSIPEAMGCELTEEGYLKVDAFQETTVKGVYACGDNATRMRTVANAAGMGTAAGIAVSKKIIFEEF